MLHVLTGPTAVGKTELALQWAEANQAEIVSCDSLLFYRGMDIGTAKPNRAELGRVPHHLIDINAVDEPLNIARYLEVARTAVDEILRRKRRVLVTGGSGFYLKAFFGPVVDDVTVPVELREEIETRLTTHGLEALVADLRALNPQGLGELDVANPRRVTRALERCRASGRTLVELKAAFAARPGAFADCEITGVQLEREPTELGQRIELRVDQMLAAGLVEEVQQLLAAGLERNPSAARSIGYRETIAMLAGELPPAELKTEIVKNTKSLARKQRTWFRTQIPQLRKIAAATATADMLFTD